VSVHRMQAIAKHRNAAAASRWQTNSTSDAFDTKVSSRCGTCTLKMGRLHAFRANILSLNDMMSAEYAMLVPCPLKDGWEGPTTKRGGGDMEAARHSKGRMCSASSNEKAPIRMGMRLQSAATRSTKARLSSLRLP